MRIERGDTIVVREGDASSSDPIRGSGGAGFGFGLGAGAGAGAGGDINKYDPYLITGISFGQQENYSVVKCFGDRNYTYAFGHDPQAHIVEISFTVFLVDDNGKDFGAGLHKLVGAYAKNRVSANQEYAVLTLGSFTLRGFIVGMSSGTANTEHNIQTFILHMLIVEAQSG